MKTRNIRIALIVTLLVAGLSGVTAQIAPGYDIPPLECAWTPLAPGDEYTIPPGQAYYAASLHDQQNEESQIEYKTSGGAWSGALLNVWQEDANGNPAVLRFTETDDITFRNRWLVEGPTAILITCPDDPAPEPPQECTEVAIAANDEHILTSNTTEYDAWQRYDSEPSITYNPDWPTGGTTTLPLWGDGAGGTLVAADSNDHAFTNASQSTATTLLLCPTGTVATPTPTPVTHDCFTITSQTIDLIFVDGDQQVTVEQREVFVFPEQFGGYNDVGYPNGDPIFGDAEQLSSSHRIWYDGAAMQDWIFHPLSGGVVLYKHYYKNGLNGDHHNLTLNQPYYYESRSYGVDEYLTFKSSLGVGNHVDMRVCQPRSSPHPPRPESCISGQLTHMQAFPYGNNGRWLYVWPAELHPSDFSEYYTADKRRPAAEDFVYLNYDFYGWTLEALQPNVEIDMVYNQHELVAGPDIQANPGSPRVIDEHTETVSIRTKSIDPGSAFNPALPAFELCPPQDWATNTPTPTPTNTPVPPIGCYVQPIAPYQDTTINFVTPNDVYRWYTAIGWDSGTQSGQLDDYGGTELQVMPGDTITFSPPAEHPFPELLVCPGELPTNTPTATGTIDPYDDPRCQVLHSAYDAPSALHRINFADDGYRATNGGFHLVLDDDHQYELKALNGSPKITNYQPGGASSYNFLDPDDGFWHYPIGTDYELSADDAGGAFSIMLCKDEPLPTMTNTATGTSTPTNTPTMGSQTTIEPTQTNVVLPTHTGELTSTAACVPVPTVPTAQLGTVPDLSIQVPTFEPVQFVTATVVITTSMVQTTVASTTNGMQTPQAQISTAIANYTWQNGADTAAAWAAVIQPALSWLAVANPQNPAYEVIGGPLWAMAPVLLPVLPIILISIMIVFIRFFFWLLDWLRKLIEVVFGIIELIPGE